MSESLHFFFNYRETIIFKVNQEINSKGKYLPAFSFWFCLLLWCGAGTQGLVCARHALYHCAHPSSVTNFSNDFPYPCTKSAPYILLSDNENGVRKLLFPWPSGSWETLSREALEELLWGREEQGLLCGLVS